LNGAASGNWHGHGLRVIRERAILLGGSLSLAANQDKGTVLTVTLPKPPAA
jgi:signal transduction histidine kinase